jgi:hypothetical protein
MSRILGCFVEFSMRGDKEIRSATDLLTERMNAFGTMATQAGTQLQTKFSAASDVVSKALNAQLKPALAGTSAAFSQQIIIVQNYGNALLPVVLRGQVLAGVLAELEKRMDRLEKFARQGSKVGGLDAAQKGMGEELDRNEGKLARMSKQLEGIARFAAIGFASLTGIIGGFVRQGLAGTAQGERMSLAFERLSMQIAAVFLPVVEKVTQIVERLANWFRSLSGAQQDSILKWVTQAAAVFFAVTAYSKLVSIGALVVDAFQKMKVAAIGFNLATLNFVGLIASIATAVYLVGDAWDSAEAKSKSALDSMRDNVKATAEDIKKAFTGDFWKNVSTASFSDWWDAAKKALLGPLAERSGGGGGADKDRRDVLKSGGSIESIEATWNRLAQASVKIGAGGGKTATDEINDKMDLVQAALGGIRGALDGLRPAVGR